MIKEILLFIFLIMRIVNYFQNDDISSSRIQKIEQSQRADFPFYCDNEIQAHFPGGEKKWTEKVIKNFRTKFLEKNNVPTGTYKTLVTFMISKNGKIVNIKTDTNFGYGIESEMIRAIKKCPKWIPAMNCGKKINSFRKQPIILIVS